MYGTPELPHPNSYDTYAEEMQTRMRNAYALVREHLGAAAVRYKRQYDLRVRPQQYAVGQWVLYFNLRRMQGKQEKWRRKYTGPFLIVKTIGPVNVML